MRAPNDMWMITIEVLTGPWHVASSDKPQGDVPSANHWYIVNMLTGKSKKIGRVRTTGMNFCDRATVIARERNKEFLAKHMREKTLPTFLGINKEFDKTIAQHLQGEKRCT